MRVGPDFGRYAIGIVLVLVCAFLEYSVLSGRDPISGLPFVPSVPAEMVGRIIGFWEAGTLMFFAWLYQTSKNSGAKDDTINRLSDRPKGR